MRAWTFDREPSGGLPRGWEGSGGVARSVYSIAREGDGNAYLKASSHDDGVQLGVEVQADAKSELVLGLALAGMGTAEPVAMSGAWKQWTAPPPFTPCSVRDCFLA